MLNWIVWNRTIFFIETIHVSSSCRATSKHLPDPLSPLVSIIHCSREVFKAISCIGTELLYIRSCWSFCLWRDPQEYFVCEFCRTSPAVSRMSGSAGCFVRYCLQGLFSPWSFFSIRLLSIHVVHPYSSIDTTAAWKKLCYILSVTSDFHMNDRL